VNRKHKVLVGIGFGASVMSSVWLAHRVRALGAIVEQLELVNAAHVEQRQRFRSAIRELTKVVLSGTRGLASAYRELGAEQEARAERAARCTELERECEGLRRRAAARRDSIVRAVS
jgi:biopolymer transport protein ExbB/TolQ